MHAKKQPHIGNLAITAILICLLSTFLSSCTGPGQLPDKNGGATAFHTAAQTHPPEDASPSSADSDASFLPNAASPTPSSPSEPESTPPRTAFPSAVPGTPRHCPTEQIVHSGSGSGTPPGAAATPAGSSAGNTTSAPKPTASANPHQEPSPIKDSREYLSRTLLPDEKKAYGQIRDAMLNMETVISAELSAQSPEALRDKVTKVVDCVRYDYPEIFWYTNELRWRYQPDTLTVTSIQLELTAAEDILTAQKEQIDRMINEILQSIPSGADEYEVSKILYEWIILHTDYASASISDSCYTAAGVFLDGKAVCSGYAKAYQLLMLRAGIPCLYVTGITEKDSVGHAWNISCISGKWYHTDVTWGDPVFSQGGYEDFICYDYLNVTEADIRRSRSITETLYPLPACTSSESNYFVKEERFFSAYHKASAEKAIGAALLEAAAVRAPYIAFRFADAAAYQQARAELNLYTIAEQAGPLPNPIQSYAVITGSELYTILYRIQYKG